MQENRLLLDMRVDEKRLTDVLVDSNGIVMIYEGMNNERKLKVKD